MKYKVLIILLIVTSLFGYLAWGGDQQAYLWEAEWDIIQKLFSNPKSVAHPFILIPLSGQLLLLIALFQHQPNPKLIFTAIGCIGLLLVFILLAGILSTQVKIIASTIPFLATAIYTIQAFRSQH
jgi:hypothetical protein